MTGASSVTATALTFSGVTSFSQFMIGAADSALPVEMTNFTAAASSRLVTLSWSTATETNNFGFEIERRALKSSNWSTLGFVKGNGTSNAKHSYAFSDEDASVGAFVYRLKQMDNDGSYKYSSEAEVTIGAPTAFALRQNYPNPFNPTTTIAYDIPAAGAGHLVTLKVYDLVGREVATLVEEQQEPGRYEAKFDASRLAGGVYFYRIQAGSYTETKKLLLLK